MPFAPAMVKCLCALGLMFPLTAAASDARAHWLDRQHIAWRDAGDAPRLESRSAEGVEELPLTVAGIVEGPLADRHPHLAGQKLFRIPAKHLAAVPALLKTAVRVLPGIAGQDATYLQQAGVLDDLFAYRGPLGQFWQQDRPQFRLWAPTATRVDLLVYERVNAEPVRFEMIEDRSSGTWSFAGEAAWDRWWYQYEVTVFVRETGRMETHRVTDPWSLSLSIDSRLSQVIRLDDPDLLPEGWQSLPKPPLQAPEDIVLYELHVRDFSISDSSVPAEKRGTFAAFTEAGSQGQRHLRELARAGLSHVHLLPAFDCATIPENPADREEPAGLDGHAPDSPAPQQAVGEVRGRDGFNWCYDPYHFTVPEGSYSTDPHGPQRIREFREMVSALNRMGLRVVMDVVYNHTTTHGLAGSSVLDRIVPGYFHRLDASGEVESSTCCSNTATEHFMMERLMRDSLLTWAREYKVDGFRFDLMGHHSRGNILAVQNDLRALTPERDGVDGTGIYLYGEGWNFGEVANDARFIQATQANMGAGTGVGTFNDRLRDAARGGAHDDRGRDHLRKQGFVNGLYLDPNAENTGSDEEKSLLLHATDLIRLGLAGSLADFPLVDHRGRPLAGRDIDYHGQAAGYTSDPQEAVNYVAAHDNETLFDINQYKLPRTTPMAERVRAQNLATSLVLLAQGVPLLHAGQELLRSKSLDRNSYDSGDWFNLLDFSFSENGWGRGLPPRWDNAANWSVAGPMLADPTLEPDAAAIRSARAHVLEMLAIRRSSPLFRLRSGEAVKQALRFHNTGPGQVPGLVVMSIEWEGAAAVALINAATVDRHFGPGLAGDFELHPVQQRSHDPRTREARFEQGLFHVPARTASVFLRRD